MIPPRKALGVKVDMVDSISKIEGANHMFESLPVS
jgi:hypothetical protein